MQSVVSPKAKTRQREILNKLKADFPCTFIVQKMAVYPKPRLGSVLLNTDSNPQNQTVKFKSNLLPASNQDAKKMRKGGCTTSLFVYVSSILLRLSLDSYSLIIN